MHNQITTDKHINNLIEFRQALYQHGFTRLRDAQFELVDALLLSWPIRSFPELSLNPGPVPTPLLKTATRMLTG